MNIRIWLIIPHIFTTLLGFLLTAWLLDTLGWGLPLPVLALIFAFLSAAIGYLLIRPLAGRLTRIAEITQAWNRGHLTTRISDNRKDPIGQISGQFDQLAEHLEQDERDLEELRQRNSRLTDQVRALTVVEERNRLARELHDSVKQHLFSLAMTASAIRTQLANLENIPEEVNKMVLEVESAAQTAQRETTRLIGDLRPGSLQERGLSTSLNDFTLLFGAQEHLLVYLDVQGKEPQLAPPVTEALYRVTQEALHNVARHAQATRVDVRLRYLPGHVRLIIVDNGGGFDLHLPQRGLGLANMQERMLEVGGRLDIESQAGTGTRITAEVGLVDPRARQAEIAEQERTALIPTSDHWSWLGQKLVIPVGQTWPWLPADSAHLRQPLVEMTDAPLSFHLIRRPLGFGKDCRFQAGNQSGSRVRIRPTWRGYAWNCDGARWRLRNYGGLNRRQVLFRKGQPLAAMQYRGRQMQSWSEIVYDGRGYRISPEHDRPQVFIVKDQAGDSMLTLQIGNPMEIQLARPLPVHLIILVALRVTEETPV